VKASIARAYTRITRIGAFVRAVLFEPLEDPIVKWQGPCDFGTYAAGPCGQYDTWRDAASLRDEAFAEALEGVLATPDATMRAHVEALLAAILSGGR
jgi:hypothetical protein